jgi:ferredoxin/flavodoxin
VKKISTVIYYYSATGNSLYVARELQKVIKGAEIRSIAEALHEDRLEVNAECVGFVFPMHYFGLPLQVEEFLQKLTILESPYIFAIATCGVPYWSRPFVDAEKILKEKNRQIHAAWYVRLVSNYIPLRDIAADWRINIRAWLAERKLKKIAGAIEKREHHETWQLLKKFCAGYHEKWKAEQRKIDENFQCDREKCTSCGLCERICPRGNILRPQGQPVWQHSCVECLGCLHICPVKAIEYGEITKGRKRYRHKNIEVTELIRRTGKEA